MGKPRGLELPTNQLPKGNMHDPRGRFDYLYADHHIEYREYAAGRFYRERYYGTQLYDHELYKSCNDALKKGSAFWPSMVRLVAVDDVKLELTSDIELIKRALSRLAMHIEFVAQDFEQLR